MIASKTIGFDRKIDIEWLDAVAGRVAAGDTSDESPKRSPSYPESVVVPERAKLYETLHCAA